MEIQANASTTFKLGIKIKFSFLFCLILIRCKKYYTVYNNSNIIKNINIKILLILKISLTSLLRMYIHNAFYTYKYRQNVMYLKI